MGLINLALRREIIKCGKGLRSNIHFTHITAKRVTSCGAHLHDLAPGLRSSRKTSQRWREVGDAVSDLTSLGIEPSPSRTDSHVRSI